MLLQIGWIAVQYSFQTDFPFHGKCFSTKPDNGLLGLLGFLQFKDVHLFPVDRFNHISDVEPTISSKRPVPANINYIDIPVVVFRNSDAQKPYIFSGRVLGHGDSRVYLMCKEDKG